VARLDPTQLLLLDQSEDGLFKIHGELSRTAPHVDIVPCICGVRDAKRIDSIFARYRPDVVIHAAAHKHVPMMEWNPGEALKNNVFGTRIVADLADEYSVQSFVMISTDKAVNPTSVMGASKRAAEMYVQARSRNSATRFVTVRFGNVLGSAGSVVPIFQEQIANGGPVSVTHPDMRRYFMTIPEACQLVLQAGTMGKGGEIFILDMGEPVKIVELARNLILLSGLTTEEMEIRFTGLRPGEKLYEELALRDEIARKTRHPKIFIGRLRSADWDDINRQVEDLQTLANGEEEAAILRKIKEIVPEFAGGQQNGAVPALIRDHLSANAPAMHAIAKGPKNESVSIH
jgi:FlaA1/EpsC-like NDP-sugar epimerase